MKKLSKTEAKKEIKKFFLISKIKIQKRLKK